MAALFVVTPSYSAVVKLYVSGTGATAGERLSNGEYARTHISSYAELVNSNELLEAVREDLGLPPADGEDDLAKSISASNPLDSLIIVVTVNNASPDQAQAVAAATGKVYNSVVAKLESPPDGRASPVRINVVTPPTLPTTRDSPNRKVYAVAGLVGGLCLGIAAAWLLELHRPLRPGRAVHRQGSGNRSDELSTVTTLATPPGVRRHTRTPSSTADDGTQRGGLDSPSKPRTTTRTPPGLRRPALTPKEPPRGAGASRNGGPSAGGSTPTGSTEGLVNGKPGSPPQAEGDGRVRRHLTGGT